MIGRIDEVREMLLSKDEQDFALAVNILQNRGMTLLEITELIEEVLKDSQYMVYSDGEIKRGVKSLIDLMRPAQILYNVITNKLLQILKQDDEQRREYSREEESAKDGD